MDLAAWRSPLARALHRNRSLVYSRYLQLATVRSDGYPANRTVVFRGFWAETNQLQFVTDARSGKIEQIGQAPVAEACWYFPTTREQFRLAGQLTLVAADYPDRDLLAARQHLWQTLSDPARTQFTWADPGQPSNDDREWAESTPDPTTPLPTFCLLLLDPDRVDHLELRGNPQNRWLYHREATGGWSRQAVNP
ncbi:Npun_F5749 family FMN-dependent PPOX-type flavoprotein [Pantanalinema rosaneae CENA516]|uniref:Npun_F5749 family FMN-dependent PPOX-type flavoprotein n=1 Tax=Pantanalinema rosaneae TaxID=1620701 RepID=UPI003D701A93